MCSGVTYTLGCRRVLRQRLQYEDVNIIGRVKALLGNICVGLADNLSMSECF